MGWEPKYPVNFTPDGDTTSQALEKHINEFDRVYELLNRVRKFDAGDTAPTDPIEGHAWLDTSNSPWQLKVYNGTDWVDILVGNAVNAENAVNADSAGNADTVDSFHASQTPAAKTIPVADENGYINNWINQGEGSGLDADLLRGLPADFTCSKNTNGYTKLPNGLIIQWGRTNEIAHDSFVSVTFPITFPNECFCVVAVANVPDGTDQWATVRKVSATSFIARMEWDTGNYNDTGFIRWIAIGY